MSDVETLSNDIDKSVNMGKSMLLKVPEQCKSVLGQLKNTMNIFTLNIRSLNRNFDDLQKCF